MAIELMTAVVDVVYWLSSIVGRCGRRPIHNVSALFLIIHFDFGSSSSRCIVKTEHFLLFGRGSNWWSKKEEETAHFLLFTRLILYSLFSLFRVTCDWLIVHTYLVANRKLNYKISPRGRFFHFDVLRRLISSEKINIKYWNLQKNPSTNSWQIFSHCHTFSHSCFFFFSCPVE